VTDEAYRLSEDRAELDLERVHHWLSEGAYWALGRSRETVERSFAGSYPAGVFAGAEQVAVARIVSDATTFAWLCDVYVDPGHRGHGLGQTLARWAVGWARRHGVYRVMLATHDAHGVYATVGFRPPANPGNWMELDLRRQHLGGAAGDGGQ
jgi:GNAT superfamily N-acetyltransferase